MSEFFRRIEKKYLINREQYLEIKNFLEGKMVEDEHGKSTICNIYYDTDNYNLIMHSITKPIFKEKIRLRSYNIPNMQSDVFLEIKRKFDGIVSKRRVKLKLEDYYKIKEDKIQINGQVENELKYYFEFYNLKPKVFLSYSRKAYYDKENADFRITFDSNILARDYDLKIEKGIYGVPILAEGKYIMEIKTLGAIPIWYVKKINELKLAPCGFSKYGEAYTQLILGANKVAEYVI